MTWSDAARAAALEARRAKAKTGKTVTLYHGTKLPLVGPLRAGRGLNTRGEGIYATPSVLMAEKYATSKYGGIERYRPSTIPNNPELRSFVKRMAAGEVGHVYAMRVPRSAVEFFHHPYGGGVAARVKLEQVRVHEVNVARILKAKKSRR